MNTTLYFLRSSEQKIVTDMLYYAASLDRTDKILADYPHLGVYEKHYGFTNKDLGLYALCGHELAGAAWIRLFNEPGALSGRIDAFTPVLTIGVKPEFRGQGVASAMLGQLLLEAGALYENISVNVIADSPAIRLFERHGFVEVADMITKSTIDGSDILTMKAKLCRADVKRPSERYDPRRWMD